MNKKRNYARTMLLGALVCGIAGPAFVGCKDYDDDIDSLQAQVNTLNQGLADLKKLVESGKSITEVTPVEGGFRITFNDNTSYEIVNGTSGTSGSVVTVNDEGHLFIDGVDKGKVVNENSATSADPVITIDDEGYICVNGTRQTGAQLSMTPGDSYAVVKDKVIEFYLPNEKGEMPTEPIKVWKSGLLTGLMTLPTHLYEISDNGLLFPTIYGVDAKGNYVRLYAGKTTLQYEINPKSADVTVNGLTTKQIASRAVNEKFQISGEPTIADGILSVQAKAMGGLFSYNKLFASDGTTEVKDYVYRFDEFVVIGFYGTRVTRRLKALEPRVGLRSVQDQRVFVRHRFVAFGMDYQHGTAYPLHGFFGVALIGIEAVNVLYNKSYVLCEKAPEPLTFKIARKQSLKVCVPAILDKVSQIPVYRRNHYRGSGAHAFAENRYTLAGTALADKL